MARKSKLTPEQLEEVRVKALAKIPVLQLAKEYGVNEKTIRRVLSEGHKDRVPLTKIKELAKISAQAEISNIAIIEEVRNLNPKDQDLYFDTKRLYVEQDFHMTKAAHYGSMTAHRLMMIANKEIEKVDESDLAGSSEFLVNIMKATQTANESLKPALKLKEISSKQKEEDKPKDLDDAPVKFYIPSNGRN